METPEEENPPTLIQVRVRSPRPFKPQARRDTMRLPPIPAPKVEEPVIQRKIDELRKPRGVDISNVSNVELAAYSFNTSVAVADNASGAYGERWNKHSLVREGGSEESEEAVRAALEWLRRHQSPDGGWRARDYPQHCTERCRNESARFGDGRGEEDYDVGVTGLAMLAFAGAGHTHTFGANPEYVAVLRRAIGYLKSVQMRSKDPSSKGRFGGEYRKWVYNHAIATLAVVELLILSGDEAGLRTMARDAVELCLRSQNDGAGWRYGYRTQSDDVSVVGWMLLALKAARSAPLGIPDERYARSFADAMRYIDSATSADGWVGYKRKGDRDNRADGWPAPHPFTKELSCMTSVGVLCRLFAGEPRESRAVLAGADVLMRQLPNWQEQKGRGLSTINFYYWYYGSYAMFQVGGPRWKRWSAAQQRALLEHQRGGNACENGSWDTLGEWSRFGGRVYSTALSAMTLEVYYRYRRLEGSEGD